MSLFRQWLVLLIAIAAGVVGSAFIVPREEVPLESEISVEAAQAYKDALWVDARSEVEFARGHIGDALNLNEDNWSRQIAVLLERWQPGQRIIVYCGSESCRTSHSVAERLRGKEYNLGAVQVLRGGWVEWRMRGGDL